MGWRETNSVKYLTQLLIQIGAQGFEKLSPLSPLAQKTPYFL
jgi:hypothetical protein